jgi:Flp pilus assembly protein TadD
MVSPGKTYAAWRGHDQDALSTYDALIKAVPEDFRGYLAKGVFLKERGRKGDAERMFLQAKFYAPDNMQAFVVARAGENPLLDLPDNGME